MEFGSSLVLGGGFEDLNAMFGNIPGLESDELSGIWRPEDFRECRRWIGSGVIHPDHPIAGGIPTEAVPGSGVEAQRELRP
jgi:hypothetical protein